MLIIAIECQRLQQLILQVKINYSYERNEDKYIMYYMGLDTEFESCDIFSVIFKFFLLKGSIPTRNIKQSYLQNESEQSNVGRYFYDIKK